MYNSLITPLCRRPCRPQLKDLGYDPQLLVTTDPAASSSTFLDNTEYRQALFSLFKAQVGEGKGGSVPRMNEIIGTVGPAKGRRYESYEQMCQNWALLLTASALEVAVSSPSTLA